MNRRPLSPPTCRLLWAAFCLLLTVFCLLPSVAAQSTSATLSGTVEDQNGAVVPGVEITVLNVETSAKRQATTDESGSFTIPFLPPGHYSVTARRQGFASVEVPNVLLNVNDKKALQIDLKPGNISEMVQIAGDAPLIDESPAVATTIDRQFVANLPLNGRSFQSLILLAPGVTVTPSSTRSPGQFSVNGQRTNANYFTVDGVSANTGVNAGSDSQDFSQQAGGALPGLTAVGGTTSLVSIDALEEFDMQTSSYSAQFGRQPGGQVQLLTRSGTNTFHGSAFDYVRNDIFDAQNWFNSQILAANPSFTKPPLRQNQFGGTFSGPLWLPRLGEGAPFWYNGKDRTFFFFSYEGQRLRLPNFANRVVPSLRLRQVAFAALQPILNSFPLPTGPEILSGTTPTGAAPFLASFSNPADSDAFSIRVDHSLSRKATIFGRFSNTSSNSLTRVLNRLNGRFANNRSTTIGSNSSFNEWISNELRFNYTVNLGQDHVEMDNYQGAIPIDPSILISGFTGTGVLRGQINFFNLLGGNLFQVAHGANADSYQRQINIVDNLSWIKGPHLLKFGVDFRRLSPVYAPVTYQQTVTFRTEARILSGLANNLAISAFQGARPRFDNYSLYAADTWKVSPKLTLDLGLRWEFNPPPTEASGKKPTTVIGITGNDVTRAALAPADAPFYKTFYSAFAPRIGAAYLLRQRPGRETVLRGGFGFYYDLGTSNAFSGYRGHPFRADKSATNVQFPLSQTIAQPPPFLPATLPIVSPLFAINPDLKLPLTLAWNLAVEQSLGEKQTITLSYVASAGRRLTVQEGLNQRIGDPFSGPFPNPNFVGITYTTNGPTSDYHSLQAQFQRRLSRGLQSLVSYTWAHAIDEASSEVQPGILERGNADFDVRHKLSAAVTYDLPKMRAGRFLSAILGGWSLDGVLIAQSGQPLNLLAGRVDLGDGTNLAVRPDVVAGVPFWIADPAAPGRSRINPAAFQIPPIKADGFFARQGTLGRNVVIGPSLYQINMALRRRISLTERLTMEIRAEAFNVVNHPLFGGYSTELTASDFGFATTTLNNSLQGLSPLYQIGGPRSMQFSLRLSF